MWVFMFLTLAKKQFLAFRDLLFLEDNKMYFPKFAFKFCLPHQCYEYFKGGNKIKGFFLLEVAKH